MSTENTSCQIHVKLWDVVNNTWDNRLSLCHSLSAVVSRGKMMTPIVNCTSVLWVWGCSSVKWLVWCTVKKKSINFVPVPLWFYFLFSFPDVHVQFFLKFFFCDNSFYSIILVQIMFIRGPWKERVKKSMISDRNFRTKCLTWKYA